MSKAIPSTAAGPLKKLRIIDLGTMVAGPVICTYLGDFGADIIKVEQPNGGDTVRALGPFKDGESLLWQVEARNKKSITIDLRKPAGQELLKRLVKEADAVVENFRPGTLEGWNLGYEQLRAVNPRIVLVSVSGFGQTGPLATRAGYDRIGLAFSGVMAATGEENGMPVRVGISAADYSTATMGAFALMMALYHRDANGGAGQHIDLSLYETMFRFTDSMVTAFDQLDIVRKRTGNVHQFAAPGNNFLTSDGRYLVITISSDSVFRKLCGAIDQPGLATDPRYLTHIQRWQAVHELNEIVARWAGSHTAAEAGAMLDAHGVPYSPLLDVRDIFANPQYEARGNIVSVQHPKLGPLKMQSPTPRMLGTPCVAPRAAPELGEHTDLILKDVLRMGDQEISRLRQDAVI